MPSVEQIFPLAIQQQQAGRFAEAEKLYRQILGQNPQHHGALHQLGTLAGQAGRIDIARTLFEQAIAIDPNQPLYHHSLGIALKAGGQENQALDAFDRALRINSARAEIHFARGLTLKGLNRLEEAIAAYRRAVELKPDFIEARYNLANALTAARQWDQAISTYQEVIRLNPRHVQAYNNLGVALVARERRAEAIAAYRRAVELQDNFADAHFNLANALNDDGQHEAAIASYRRAIALNPTFADAHNNLGDTLKCVGQLDQAIASYHRAIELNPQFGEAYSNLGAALTAKGQLDAANAAGRRAVALSPNLPQAHNNLACALKDQGLLDESIAQCRQANSVDSDYALAHSNLLFTLQYHDDCTAKLLYEESRNWNRRHAESLKKTIELHANDRSPERPLRIGYVSPDFREHCQALFTTPLLSHHDHRRFHITAYADVSMPDATTRGLQKYFDQWRGIAGLSDAQTAAQIRTDEIDILVDLTMHMANNRLRLFARKPAPVQVTWLAYPGSTGLDAIDYRLTDPYLDPAEADLSVYSEQTWRLRDTFWCYDPRWEAPVNALPAESASQITFGCLNNFCKVTEQTLRNWAGVLRAVPRSRLMLLSPEGTARDRVLKILQDRQVATDRIQFVSHRPRAAYLQLYHRIDICLDTLPYNGHTTSLDSFWMGVPVVTLVGQTIVGRAGLSQLTNLGLPELIAHSPEQFIGISKSLAEDLPRLRELRATLRPRMTQSPLMDAPRFAGNIEAAYQQMWKNYCAGPIPAAAATS